MNRVIGRLRLIKQRSVMQTKLLDTIQGSTSGIIKGKLFKVMTKNENQFGYQYQSGLNILTDDFNDDPKISCGKGGFYFTNAQHIFHFLHYGHKIREVQLPIDDIDLKVTQDPSKTKWRTNKIILGDQYLLSEIKTFEYLINEGAGDIDLALYWCVKNNFLEGVKFLLEKGANVLSNYGLAVRLSARHGHNDILQYFIENKNIYPYDEVIAELDTKNNFMD